MTTTASSRRAVAMNRAMIDAFNRGYRLTASGGVIGVRGRLLRLGQAKFGYYQFGVQFEGRPRTILVHRFVAYCKYGDALFSAECVRHLDGDPTNNSWDNIVIGSVQDNSNDRLDGAKLRWRSNVSRSRRLLTPDQVRSIRYWYNRFNPETGEVFTQSCLAEVYGVSRGCVRNAIDGKYRHIA